MPEPERTGLLRCRASAFTVKACLLLFLFGVWGVQTARAGLTIEPTTWNVVGLDSNNTSVGPNTFPTGGRVCNTGAATVTNVSANFVWDSFNTYVNLSGPSTINVSSLAAGACVDFYFAISVTRTPAAYDATRRYHITVTGDSVASVTTPTPREIYVERIISQNRNSINSITGPTTVFVGQTYNYTVNASTATGGYSQLEAFLELSNIIFQVQAISTTYTAPSGGTNNKFYADACGWDNNPLSPGYRSCIGPENYPGGKAGGTVVTTYTVKVLSTGTTTASTLVLDFSGSSYHYNNDYGTKTITITALPAPAPDLTITKTHSGNFTQGQTGATYSITVTNSGLANTSGTVTVTDTLPAGLTATAIAGTNWVCVLGTLTCTRSDALVPGASYPAITVTVDVANNAPASVTNTANVSGGGEIITTNNTATDPTTIDTATAPAIVLVKSVNPNGAQPPGTELSYTIVYTNAGGQPANNFILVDPNVQNVDPLERVFRNVDFKVGSMISSPGTSGLIASFEYSNDGGATWTYTPASGGGGAPSGYDRNVTNVRWVFTGSLNSITPDNSGSVEFVVRIR